MRYQSGRMGLAEGIALTYGVSFPLVFLSTPSFLAEAAGPMSWATPLIGGLAAGALLWIQQSLLKNFSGDLLALAEHLLGKLGAYAVGLFYLLATFAVACLWTRQFAENTLLTALPVAEFSHILFVYAVGVMILVYLGIEALTRAGYLILPFAVGGLLLVMAGLAPMMKPLYLTPLLGNGLPSLIKPTVLFVGASAPTAILMFLAPAFQNAKTLQAALLYGYGGSAVIRSLASAVYVAIFSAAVATEKTLPFYEMARLLYLNRYVQRLEALFILLWVVAGLVGISLCLYGSLYIIARLFRLPSPIPLLLPMGLIMVNLAAIPQDTGDVLMLGISLFMNILAPGFAATTLALLVAARLKKKGGRPCAAA